MPKLKQRYISFFDFLLDEEQGFLHDQGIGEFYYEEIEYNAATQFLGALQPFHDLRKDFRETFTPYPTFKSVLYEFLQPFKGILNISKMFSNTIGVPFTFILCTLFFCFDPATFLVNMRINFIRSGSWLVDGFASGIRGLVQLITTPFTLSLRMLLRGILITQKEKLKPSSVIHKEEMKPAKPSIHSLMDMHAKKQMKLFECTVLPFLDTVSLTALTTTSRMFHSLNINKAWDPLIKEFTEKEPQLFLNESKKNYCISVFFLRETIKEALKKPNTPTKTFNQLFAEVLVRGCEKLQPMLIDKINVQVSLRSYKQVTVLNTFLHHAAKQGDYKLMQTLLEKGAVVDAVGPGFIPLSDEMGGTWVDHQGYTPLDVAAMNGHVDCMGLLIERGADFNHRSIAYGDTPLHHAARYGYTQCVNLLLQHNARVDIRDKQQRLALDLASENNHMNCVDSITNYINQHQVMVPQPPSTQCSIL